MIFRKLRKKKSFVMRKKQNRNGITSKEEQKNPVKKQYLTCNKKTK